MRATRSEADTMAKTLSLGEVLFVKETRYDDRGRCRFFAFWKMPLHNGDINVKPGPDGLYLRGQCFFARLSDHARAWREVGRSVKVINGGSVPR